MLNVRFGLEPEQKEAAGSHVPGALEKRAEESGARRQVTLIGIGMGTAEGMTVEAAEEIRKADLLIGARRMLDAVQTKGADPWLFMKANRSLQPMSPGRSPIIWSFIRNIAVR